MRTTGHLRLKVGTRVLRVVVMVTVAMLGVAGRASATPPACSAGPDAPRDINTYMLFAYTDLYVKGGTAAVPGRGLFTGGNLGSNGVATVGDPNATLGTNYGVYLSDGNAAVADRITLGPGHPLLPTSVWDLFTNEITNNDFTPSSVRNLGPICFGPPIIDPLLPSFVAFTHPGGPYQPTLPSFPSEAALNALPDIHLPGGFMLNLAPGSYGDIDLNDDSILNLTNGIYNLHSLQAGRNVTINTAPGTDVRIAVDFRSNNDLTIQGSDLARFYIRSDGLGPATFSFTLGFNSAPDCPTTIAIHGQFFIPNGRINLGDCTNIFGRVWADVIRNDTNINVTYRAAAALYGVKYLDANGDGQIEPGETGLSGLTFYVDYDNDSMLDADEPSGVSDANGDYVIDGVAAGTWTLRELGDPSFVCSFPAGCSYGLTIADGAVQTGFDFANWTASPRRARSSRISTPTVATRGRGARPSGLDDLRRLRRRRRPRRRRAVRRDRRGGRVRDREHHARHVEGPRDRPAGMDLLVPVDGRRLRVLSRGDVRDRHGVREQRFRQLARGDQVGDEVRGRRRRRQPRPRRARPRRLDDLRRLRRRRPTRPERALRRHRRARAPTRSRTSSPARGRCARSSRPVGRARSRRPPTPSAATTKRPS